MPLARPPLLTVVGSRNSPLPRAVKIKAQRTTIITIAKIEMELGSNRRWEANGKVIKG